MNPRWTRPPGCHRLHENHRTPCATAPPEILAPVLTRIPPIFLKDLTMKTQLSRSFKFLAPAAAVLAVLGSPTAFAESNYGYSAAGTGIVSANARVNLRINVPKLILLRVGSSGAVADTVTFTVAPNPGIPGGIAAAALASGNNRATGWNGTAPVMGATAAPANVTAYAWTNALGGGNVSFAMSTPFTTGGLTGASITVASAPVSGGGLAHPGATLAAATPTAFPANSLRSSTWTYGLSAAALASVTAGTHNATVTYTATSL